MLSLSRSIVLMGAAAVMTGCGLANVPACVFGNGYQFNLKSGNTTVGVTDGDAKISIGNVSYLSVGSPCAAIVGVETQPDAVKVARNGTAITPTESKRTVNQYSPEPLGLHLLEFRDEVDPGTYTYDIEGFSGGKSVGKRQVTIDTAASPLKGVPQLTVTGTTWTDAKLSWTPVEGAQSYWVTFSVDDPKVGDKTYWNGLVSTQVQDKKTTFDVKDYLTNSLHPDSRIGEPGLVAAANDLKKPIKIDVRAETQSGRSGEPGQINWTAHAKTQEIAPGTFDLPAPAFDRMKAEELAREAKK